MINRRLIRIKILQEIYAYDKRGDGNAVQAEKEFFRSIEKSYELYLFFIQLLIDVSHRLDLKIDQIKNRNIKADEEWQRLSRLQNNRILKKITENSTLLDHLKSHKINWSDDGILAKETLNAIINSELYADLQTKEDTFANDRKFLSSVCTDIILSIDKLYDFLEERSIFWNDEEDFILSMVVKSIKKCKSEDDGFSFFKSPFKDDEDLEYTKRFFRKALASLHKFDKDLDDHISNWEIDRVAEIDLIILRLAIIEAEEFPSIPTKVSINEFIEISKIYSTEKSGIFINGILDKLFKKYIAEKVIIKKGRGLIE